MLARAACVRALRRGAGQGKTALHLAAERGHTEVVQALLSAGADAGGRETIGCTPLHRACETPHPATVAALLAAGEREPPSTQCVSMRLDGLGWRWFVVSS